MTSFNGSEDSAPCGPEGGAGRPRMQPYEWLLAGLLFLGTCLVLTALLRGALFGLLNLEYSRYKDYACYTNMLWNTAHGHPFAWGVNGSYLQTHLSFSLGLIAPLFWVWDHPALLLVVQWLFLVMGVGFLGVIGVRMKLRAPAIAAVMLFYTACHFTQGIMLREFHGVSAYLALIPGLYYCLAFNRKWVWLPLALVLGLREEAGLVVIPLLLYFAVTRRWRAGYLYAGAVLAYVLLACLVLYPWISGMSLAARRHTEMANAAPDLFFSPDSIANRLKSLGWILLPLAPFLVIGWRPVTTFIVLPVLLSLGSLEPGQYRMEHHYPALVVAVMGVAMLHVVSQADRRLPGGWPARRLAMIWLVIAVGLSFYAEGLLPGSRPAPEKQVYRKLERPGVHALQVVRTQLPREGILTAPKNLRCLVANRRDVRWGGKRGIEYQSDVTLAMEETGDIDPVLRAGVSNGTWRVIYSDALYTIFEKTGGPASDPAGKH